MANEQNMKELEMSELREKLRKREDELRDLKSNLNGQISGVVEQYHQQLEDLKVKQASTDRDLA